MKTTIENNKMIAEFMGLELEETLSGKMVYAIEINSNNPKKTNDIKTDFFEVDELKYHLSWDWLMPVAQKCREEINKYKIIPQEMGSDKIIKGLFIIDMNYLYKAVIGFIYWYNENKYPFKEGDDYYTIEKDVVVWSCWDDVSEEVHDENPDKVYFLTKEDASNNNPYCQC